MPSTGQLVYQAPSVWAPCVLRRAPRRRWEPSGLAVVRRKQAQCSGMDMRRSVRPSLPSIRTCRRSNDNASPPPTLLELF